MFGFLSRFSPRLEPEVVRAYIHRLPERIQVSWTREGKFIVGKIEFKGEEIFTQGRTPKEFVHMVNDAVYIALDFKPEYIDAFHKHDAYVPDAEAWKALNDGAVKEDSFGFNKQPAKELAIA